MKTLVVYYSLTGNTRAVATALARGLGADVEEIRCGRYSSGFWSLLRAASDSWRGKLPLIDPLIRTPSHYDLVLIGGPMWAFHAATPVRAFLRQERSRLQNVAFFLTLGGAPEQRAFREMEDLAGRLPVATLVVREADARQGQFGAAVSSFVATLRMKKAA